MRARSAALRRLLVIGVPMLLGLLELSHPALLPSDDILGTIEPIAVWWTALHVAQVPLFALLGLAVFLLIEDLDGTAAWLSRRAIAVFIVAYPAFDAAVGIASGIVVQNLGPLGADGRGAIEPALGALFWGPVTGTLAIIGALSWLVALLSAAWAWRGAGAPALACGLLALSGVALAIGHIRPFGPLACLSFLAAAAWLDRGWRPMPARNLRRGEGV